MHPMSSFYVMKILELFLELLSDSHEIWQEPSRDKRQNNMELVFDKEHAKISLLCLL